MINQSAVPLGRTNPWSILFHSRPFAVLFPFSGIAGTLFQDLHLLGMQKEKDRYGTIPQYNNTRLKILEPL